MRAKPLPPAEFCRRPIDATDDDVRQGRYIIPFKKEQLRVIASDGNDWLEIYDPPVWEHVSVSLPHRCPTWEELDFIKNLWWREDETVIQLHVPRDRHVNYHPFCLHLWKPVGIAIPLPPPSTVGPNDKVIS